MVHQTISSYESELSAEFAIQKPSMFWLHSCMHACMHACWSPVKQEKLKLLLGMTKNR